MATVLDTRQELEKFHRWLGDRLAKGDSRLTLEESVAEFREFTKHRKRLEADVRPALERSLRGESRFLDAATMKAEVTRRLAAKGIVDEPDED